MFILASKSPRRIEILKNNNYQFDIFPSDIEEITDNNLKPVKNALDNALNKAIDVSHKNPNKIVVAADTMVVFKGEVYGKPKSEEDAFIMLKKLSNNKHYVYTAVAIVKEDKHELFYSKSSVYFKDINDETILNYIKTKEPLDKAGSYAIQGEGRKLIKTFKGDYYNIMGLPIKKFNSKIIKFLK